MKIKILKSVAGLTFAYTQDDTVDTTPEIAKDLIKAKYAVEVKGIPTVEVTETPTVEVSEDDNTTTTKRVSKNK